MQLIKFLTNLDYTVIALISAFFGATANIAARVLLKNVKSYNIMGLSFLMVGSTMLIISPLFYFFEPSWITIGLLYSIAIIDATGNYFYFKTFEKTEANIASSMLALTPAFTFIGSWIFLSNTGSNINILLSFLIITTIVIFSADWKNLKSFHFNTLLPAISASFFFGISSIPSKYLLTNLEAINAPTLYMFRATIIGMIAFIFMRPNLSKLGNKHYGLIWFQGLLAITTGVSLYYALSKGNAGITITLANTVPAFTIILSALFLKEKITLKKLITVLLVLGLSALITFS